MLCPFSVHRMALAGKELGKDIGQWFGPSTAAGAIKCVDVVIACWLNFDTCSDLWSKASASLGISIAVDDQIFQTKCTRHHIRLINILSPASYQDREDVQSSCSSVFSMVYTA